MKTRESQDYGEQDVVWFKIAFPTTRKLREGLVAIADETGVARSGILSSGVEARACLARPIFSAKRVDKQKLCNKSVGA